MTDTQLALVVIAISTFVGLLIAGGLGALIAFFGSLWFVNQ